MENKWKNYGLWGAIFAMLPIAAQSLGDYNINVIIPHNYEELVNIILIIMVYLGIISNPSVGKWFNDKEEK